MSFNSEVHINRKIFDKVWNVNDPPVKPSPFDNDFVSRIEVVNPLASAQAGIYETTAKLPEPIRNWHRASKGTVNKFRGRLSKLFPELKSLSEKELKKIETMRDKV